MGAVMNSTVKSLEKKMRDIKKWIRSAASVAAIGGLMACGDLLEVQDPSRFTDEDLDAAPAAVAAGAEGVLHAVIDNLVYTSALLGDEFQHTGTWAGWDDVDHGRNRYDQSGTSNGNMNALLRARFTARTPSRGSNVLLPRALR